MHVVAAACQLSPRHRAAGQIPPLTTCMYKRQFADFKFAGGVVLLRLSWPGYLDQYVVYLGSLEDGAEREEEKVSTLGKSDIWLKSNKWYIYMVYSCMHNAVINKSFTGIYKIGVNRWPGINGIMEAVLRWK